MVTEHTKIEPKNVEDYREFVWTPRIDSIKRPVHYIALQGVITTIHSNSGLVRRCNKCKSFVHDSCPNNCNEDWGWDLRISSRLYHDSGSIKMILTKDITSAVLGIILCSTCESSPEFLTRSATNRISMDGHSSS